MQNLITDTSTEDLIPAMESNMVAFWSPYGRAKGNTLHTGGEVDWFYTGIPFPLFNGVLRLHTNPTGVNETIQILQEKIDTQGAPALWWACSQSEPGDVGTILEQSGLESAGEVPAMAIDLAVLENEPEKPAHFTMQKVTSAEEQSIWAKIAAMGTGFPDKATEAMIKTESAITDLQYKQQHRYIGFLNSEPVATSALVLNAGVAGIYAVATLPETRRKGIGNMMTRIPLLEARELGYRVGILQASSAGYPLYKKMGFKEIYSYILYLQS